MRQDNIQIRNATPEDSRAIAELLGELGYPCSAGEAADRIDQLANNPADQLTVLAVDDRPVAFASHHFMTYFHRGETLCKVTAFVVKEAYRGRGLGTRLLKEIEEIARNQGCDRIEVTSAEHRLAAHTFYENQEYERAGIKLYKKIGNG